jgi:thiosulfate/3-mercaptopyruvate sulfurtransferase
MLRFWITALLVTCTTSAFAANGMSIDADELDRLIKNHRVVVLDARPAADYQKGHLPDARSLPFSATYERLGENGRVVSLPKAQALFSEVGLKRDDLVVIYDNGAMMFAARVLWALEVYGHEKVKLLDGGLKAWQMASRPLSTASSGHEPTQYVPTINPKRLATRFTTLVATRDTASYVILDARKEPHYKGLESDAVRFGHIPQALGISIANNFAKDGVHLKSKQELAELYKDIPKDKKVITYCNFGLVSSLEYLVMRELGYDVANYDASWQEWGNDANLPIVGPAKTSSTRP